MINDEIEVDIQGYDIDGEVIKAEGECQGGRSGTSDPFPGAGSERLKTSEKIWIYHYQSSIWRAA